MKTLKVCQVCSGLGDLNNGSGPRCEYCGGHGVLPVEDQPAMRFTHSVRCGSLTGDNLGEEFKFQGAVWSLVSVHHEIEWQELRGDDKFINEVRVDLVRVEMFLVDIVEKAKEFVSVEQVARQYGHRGDRYVSWTFNPEVHLDFYIPSSRPHTPQQVREMERKCHNG